MKDIFVSIVIPTTGRNLLYRAVESALAQIGLVVEVLVVVNRTEQLPRFADPRVKVIDARSTPGQGSSRQLGIKHASSNIIALLDDDDFWDPEKCIEQIRDIEKFTSIESDEWIAATGLTIHNPSGQQVQRPRIHDAPVSTRAPDEYLFVRKSLKRLDNFTQSSSLMFPKQLAIAVPFDSLPDIHTDWGWVIETAKIRKCQVIIGAGHRTHYDISLPNISKTNRYRQSIAWADRILAGRSPRVIGDFFATSCLPPTAHAGDIKGALTVLKHAYTQGKPGIPATLMAGRTFVLCMINFLKNKLECSPDNI